MTKPRASLRPARALAPALVMAVALALAPGAGATALIGAPFLPAANSGVPNCAATVPCAFSPAAAPGAQVTSPVNGTVVSWSVEWSSSIGTGLRFRVIRPLGATSVFLTATDPVVSMPGANRATFASSTPISIGDGIAIEDTVNGTGNPVGFTTVSGALTHGWIPTPATGTPTAPGFSTPDQQLFLNAAVEPTNAFTLAKPKLQRKKGTAKVAISLPNPGELAISTAGAVKAKAGAGFVKAQNVSVAAPGTVPIKLKPTSSTKKKLKRRGKAARRVTFTFTPSFGMASTQTLRLALKLKLKR